LPASFTFTKPVPWHPSAALEPSFFEMTTTNCGRGFARHMPHTPPNTLQSPRRWRPPIPQLNLLALKLMQGPSTTAGWPTRESFHGRMSDVSIKQAVRLDIRTPSPPPDHRSRRKPQSAALAAIVLPDRVVQRSVVVAPITTHASRLLRRSARTDPRG
jgi:hypothetical protein